MMASLDNIEGSLAEGVSTLLAVGLLVVAFVAWASWRNFHLPVGAYPYSLWGSFSSAIDGLFAATPVAGGSMQKTVDRGLGSVSYWLLENTPNPAKSTQWADYAAQYPNGDPTLVNAGQ